MTDNLGNYLIAAIVVTGLLVLGIFVFLSSSGPGPSTTSEKKRAAERKQKAENRKQKAESRKLNNASHFVHFAEYWSVVEHYIIPVSRSVSVSL